MKTYPKLTFLLASLCWLGLIMGCDRIYKRQVAIDFRNNKAMSFAVAEPGDLGNLFSRIEGMAQRNGLKCRPYNDVRKYHACREGTVSLVTYVTADRRVRIELTQFGPWNETEAFTALEKDLSAFIHEEFPGQNIQMTNPLK